MKYTEKQVADIRGHCLLAIKTMREFLADAERVIQDPRPFNDFHGPQDLPAAVSHAFGWGLANANQALERAILILGELPQEETCAG